MSTESLAIGMYAVLARDAGDFVDMIREPDMTDDALRTLYVMLITPNQRHDADTIELNSFGADFTEMELKRRGIVP